MTLLDTHKEHTVYTADGRSIDLFVSGDLEDQMIHTLDDGMEGFDECDHMASYTSTSSLKRMRKR